MSEPEDANVRTVAVAANLLIAVAKGVAALLAGSAAMLAETAGSDRAMLLVVSRPVADDAG